MRPSFFSLPTWTPISPTRSGAPFPTPQQELVFEVLERQKRERGKEHLAFVGSLAYRGKQLASMWFSAVYQVSKLTSFDKYVGKLENTQINTQLQQMQQANVGGKGAVGTSSGTGTAGEQKTGAVSSNTALPATPRESARKS